MVFGRTITIPLGFDALYPQARISTAARAARNEWLARTLDLTLDREAGHVPVPRSTVDSFHAAQ